MPYETPELTLTPEGSNIIISKEDAEKIIDVVEKWDSLPMDAVRLMIKGISLQFDAAIGAAITIPTLVTPANHATGQALNVALDWTDVSEAVSYDYQVALDADFENMHAQNDTAVSTVVLPHAANSTEYFWRARAHTASGISAYSATRDFTTIIAAPLAPILVSPADNAEDVEIETLFFIWNGVNGSPTYQIQVATDSLFSSIVFNEAGIFTTGKDGSDMGLLNDTEYFWRVRATNAGGSSPYSAVFSFTTIVAVPDAPALTTPADDATGISLTGTLDWANVTGADTYEVQVDNNSDFSSPIHDITGLAVSTWNIPSGLSNSTEYFWRARAVNAGGNSAWSVIRSFTTIVAAPGAPTLLTPTDDSTDIPVGDDLILDWSDVATAVTYEVQAADNAGFSEPVIDVTTLEASTYIIDRDTLLALTEYFWRARAVNPGGNSAWSTVFSFTTLL